VRGRVSYPYKTAGKSIVLYILTSKFFISESSGRISIRYCIRGYNTERLINLILVLILLQTHNELYHISQMALIMHSIEKKSLSDLQQTTMEYVTYSLH
jgi:hypothetical protein